MTPPKASLAGPSARLASSKRAKPWRNPPGLLGEPIAAARRLWNHDGVSLGHFIDTFAPPGDLRNLLHDPWVAGRNALYAAPAHGGGFILPSPDKTVDYRKTPDSARYEFTFSAFPRQPWL